MQVETQIEKIFNILNQINPNPKTELKYKNNFTLLVAVILSAQSTDSMVNKVTNILFTKYDSPEKIISLGIIELTKIIKKIGLYRQKSRNIIALSKILIAKYGSSIPNNYEGLIKLPGVGRKTANVILNSLFNKPTIAVDTHVSRVSKRLGFTTNNSIKQIENDLQNIIPNKWKKNAHNWLVLLGRYTCKARNPKCNICPINNHCTSNIKNIKL